MKLMVWIVRTLVASMLFFCVGCEQKPPYRIPHYTENEDEIATDDNNNGSNTDLEREKEGDYRFVFLEGGDYEPENLFVPAGVTFEQALYQAQPQFYSNRGINGLGGAKLIAEMSADAACIPYSRDNGQDRIIRILSMNRLKIHMDTTPTHLFGRIWNKEVILRSCVINSTPSIFDEHFEVNIFLTNNTGIPLDVIIRQGTMIESETENVQNIVVTKQYNVSLPPLQTSSISVLAYCAARHRSSPSGKRGRITPYVLNAPGYVYNTQQSVWDYIEAPSRNKIAFYVWGRGDETGHGNHSLTGHAFVWIKNMGYWGFGSKNGEWFGDEGVVSDHTRLRQYATDSCIVYVTDQQLRQAQQKLNQLRNSTPDYNLQLYDCTSFAMDIADAAEVYYGIRSLVFTPVDFMERLKKYNSY